MNVRLRKWGALALAFGIMLAAHDIIVGNAAVWQWSKTSATNATADPTVNWAEGMPPGVVNDSARAMMARLAEWRDDLSGSLTTAGSSTAYTLATNQGLPSPPNDGQMIAFSAHVVNGDRPTLSVDGGTAYPLVISGGTPPGYPLFSGSLIVGTPMFAKFSATTSAWILSGVMNGQFQVPLGTVLDYTGTTPPSNNFLFAAGQAISRTTYSGYFALVGTTYGAGDGSTTFNIPDLRGRVAAGLDNMGGSAAGRIGTVTTDSGTIVGTALGSGGGSATHVQTLLELVAHSHANSLTDPGHTHQVPLYNVGGNAVIAAGDGTFEQNINLATATTGITINNASTGSSNGMSLLQPMLMLTKIVRVQRHDNSFALNMLGGDNDNEIWFRPARAAGE